ncbi:MAG: aspartate kinase [Polyangiaceae bacterium]
MSVIVQKYGGSSMADVAKIIEVADRVVAAKKAGDDVVVVVSAMGKTTDQLLALAKSVTVACGGNMEAPRRELDMLVSTGERVSMALLSIAIHSRGVDAISFTGSQSGIITSDRHFDARIIEVRPHRIEDELARGKVVIVAGYQGMSYTREITTLGRGGSDTTAVALAAALGAERCEIYSDVDGVYSADPRVVTDPKHLPELDLATLQEMAEAGAKVLNAQAVEWARRAKIAIYARKTGDSHAGAKETIAREDASENPSSRVRAIIGLDRVVHAKLDSVHFARMSSIASKLGIDVVDACFSGGDASCAIPLLNMPDWEEKRRALVAEMGAHVALHDGKAIVSVVGSGLGSELGRVLSILAEQKISPDALFSSPLRISVTIDSSRLADAQRALHAAFVV